MLHFTTQAESLQLQPLFSSLELQSAVHNHYLILPGPCDSPKHVFNFQFQSLSRTPNIGQSPFKTLLANLSPGLY